MSTTFITRSTSTSSVAASTTRIPTELLRKAADSALISSFVDLRVSSSSSSQNCLRARKGSFSGPNGKGHQTKKAVIEIDSSDKPAGSSTSVFVKAIPTSSKRALKEVLVYTQLLKELYTTPLKFPKSVQIFPECYLSHEDQDQEHLLLFLENARISGFSSAFSEEDFGFDFNHALLSVETLARFHAQSFFLIKKKLGGKIKGRTAILQNFPFLKDSTDSKLLAKASRVWTHFYEQIFLKIVESENPSLHLKLGRKYQVPEALYKKMAEILDNERYTEEDLYVVTHGDFRKENLLFKYGPGVGVEPGEPVECRIVDWKNVRLAPLGADLVYFMLTSLTSRMRDEFEEKLLAFYCDTFESQLSIRYRQEGLELKEEEFSIEDFHRKVEGQYRRMLEFGLLASVPALPLISTGFSGILENLQEIYLEPKSSTITNKIEGENGDAPTKVRSSTVSNGAGNGFKISILDSLDNLEKFQQLAKECLHREELKEKVMSVVGRLVKARVL